MKAELSGRELEVLTYAVRGFTDDMIARQLGIETGTVNSYWVRIRGKMGHYSRTELVARFVQSNADVSTQTASDNHQTALEAANSEISRLVEEERAPTKRGDRQAELLAKANAEIDRLKGLLSDGQS
jgi:DNA-binding CsgD family transcriptional regulator